MGIVYLILGLTVGAVIGWLVRGNLAEQERRPSPVNRAVSAAASLATQIQAITRTAVRLNDRAEDRVMALWSPQVRGRWGIVQLERVVELGGMVRHCDFSSQLQVRLGDRVLRPGSGRSSWMPRCPSVLISMPWIPPIRRNGPLSCVVTPTSYATM